jgi:peptidoglycan/xylan/chitin deacetylase (PgdA/CDA1 family)
MLTHERAVGPVHLRFDPKVPQTARSRIEYAFRTLCAIYRRLPTNSARDSVAAEPGLHLCYGSDESREREIVLPARYVPRSPHEPPPAPRPYKLPEHPVYRRLGLTHVPVFHTDGHNVDWLGEIFEWISSADEYATTERDEIGRIPFAASLHGRYELDPTIPYASVAMFELARTLGFDLDSLPATSIAASHDLDYLTTSLWGDLRRLARNLGIAVVYERDPRLLVDVLLAMMRGAARFRSPLDCIDEMCRRERRLGITSTSNVICRNSCARDANYTLDEPAVKRALRVLHESGGELAVHSSYMSLSNDSLGEELRALRDAGYDVRGVRAHWLRYAGDDLFEAAMRVGFEYDSTVCYANRVGFRSGASFVYRPYRFATEEPYPFYEVPLAIMDGSLYYHARDTRTQPRDLCRRVLDMTDAFPNSSVSVLWHNTVFEGAQIPRNVGALYWELPRLTQRWTTAIDVVNARRSWFERAFQGEPSLC